MRIRGKTVFSTFGAACFLTLAGCSGAQSTTMPSRSVSDASPSASAMTTSAATSSAVATGTWPGTVSGADSMKIGLDTFYAQEVQMICSGTATAPSAVLRTSEGWVAEVKSVAGGFGPATVTVTDPGGKAYTFAADVKAGPTWNHGVLASLFGRSETVDGKEWRLYIEKGACS